MISPNEKNTRVLLVVSKSTSQRIKLTPLGKREKEKKRKEKEVNLHQSSVTSCLRLGFCIEFAIFINYMLPTPNTKDNQKKENSLPFCVFEALLTMKAVLIYLLFKCRNCCFWRHVNAPDPVNTR